MSSPRLLLRRTSLKPKWPRYSKAIASTKTSLHWIVNAGVSLRALLDGLSLQILSNELSLQTQSRGPILQMKT